MSQRTEGGFLRRVGNRIGGALATLVFIGIGIFAIGYGGWHLWIEHAGTQAQVTLGKCDGSVRSKTSDCSATWIQADGTKRIVMVNDVPDDSPALGFPRKPVDVRVRDDQAFISGSSVKAVGSIVAGIGFVLFWPALGLLGRLRR